MIFLTVSFTEQKILISISLTYPCFVSWFMFLVLYAKTQHQIQGHADLLQFYFRNVKVLYYEHIFSFKKNVFILHLGTWSVLSSVLCRVWGLCLALFIYFLVGFCKWFFIKECCSWWKDLCPVWSSFIQCQSWDLEMNLSIIFFQVIFPCVHVC